MSKLNLPAHLEDKIFEIKYDSNNTVKQIISYFPFSNSEKNEILVILKDNFDGFHSIFSDAVSEEEWNNNKEQIKKKFRDELFDID